MMGKSGNKVENTESLGKMMANVAKPGSVWLTSGFRGGGKTHAAVAIAEKMVEGRFPELPKVFLLTNIIFLKNDKGSLKEATPEGVYHVRTMKEVFPIVVDLMQRHGRENVLFMLVLDEAQNFIGGDTNQTNASIMMKEFLGIIRKFRMMVWFLCPSARSVGPSFRNFINSKKYAGNLTGLFRKDLKMNSEFIKAYNLDRRPEELIFFKNYDMDRPAVIIPGRPKWTRRKEELADGEYCYDHEASATFYIGGGFDWSAFNRQVGGVSSIRLLEAISEFYAKSCRETNGPDAKNDDFRGYRMQVFFRALEVGNTIKDAGIIADVPYRTARRWADKHPSEGE